MVLCGTQFDVYRKGHILRKNVLKSCCMIVLFFSCFSRSCPESDIWNYPMYLQCLQMCRSEIQAWSSHFCCYSCKSAVYSGVRFYVFLCQNAPIIIFFYFLATIQQMFSCTGILVLLSISFRSQRHKEFFHSILF